MSPLMSNPIPHDIERWEWEGGAVAVDANSASSVRGEPSRERPAHPASQGKRESQPSSSTTSSRRERPSTFASTTSPTPAYEQCRAGGPLV